MDCEFCALGGHVAFAQCNCAHCGAPLCEDCAEIDPTSQVALCPACVESERLERLEGVG